MINSKFILKRIMDLAFLLLIFIPAVVFCIFVGLFIKIDSKGPIFFKQKRLGKNNKEFIMYKFRTMFKDAHLKRKEMELQNEADGFLFKMKKDPRETKFGRKLRKTGLDELPQLINIFKGEMSFIGPRPLPVEDIDFEKLKQNSELYHQWQIRKSVKPGITGLWQISMDNHSFHKMLSWDEQYVEKYSLGLDLKILGKTTSLVLKEFYPKLSQKNLTMKEDKKKVNIEIAD